MQGQSDNRDVRATLAAREGTAPRETGLPFFFRDPGSSLYACLHQPAAEASGLEPVLICTATGHEYERCHKAMRQLAIQLARAGSAALRFDYSGTGDSAGDEASASLACWRDDIHAAIDELRRRTGQRRVAVIGLRLGATLAAQAAADRDDVDSLVLYAPVVDARSLLEEWCEAQAVHDRAHGIPASAPAHTEVLGYPLTEAFRRELQSGLALPAPSAALRRALVCTTGNGAAAAEVAQRLAGKGASVAVESSEDAAIWRREPMDALVPFKLIRRIVGWLQEGAS